MSSSTLLQIHHAHKTYGGIPALIDANLDLRAGEVHALMGENGAGKPTLIKILAGVVTPDSVDIYVRGNPVLIANPRAAFDLGLRFIHQELHVVPALTVAENIYLGHRYPTFMGMKVRWNQLYALANDTMRQLGIDHIDAHWTMARLSPGDQMLVNIARAFVGDRLSDSRRDALIYVMDEPTAALTGAEAGQLFRVIETLQARGSGVLYVTHRMDEIFRIADRVTVMRDGAVVNTFTTGDVTAADLIVAMTGRELKAMYPPRSVLLSERVRLQVRGLSTHSVRNVTFEACEGEIIGIAGLNGAGRTELLRGLIGADKVLAGEICLDGRTIRRLSPSGAWAGQIAFVPEERRSQGLILSQSIQNNMTLPHLRHLSRAGMLLRHRHEKQSAVKLGESVRLKARQLEQPVYELSGGNQQKVVFGRALARPPRVLLLDEPTRGVDVGAKADIYALIRQISEQGTTILMVSSDLPELLGMADSILIMRAGAIVERVSTQGLTQERLLALCYGER